MVNYLKLKTLGNKFSVNNGILKNNSGGLIEVQEKEISIDMVMMKYR